MPAGAFQRTETPTEKRAEDNTKQKRYTDEEANQLALAFYENDNLAASIFLEKYALTDKEGTYLEATPRQMWDRLTPAIVEAEEDNKDHWTAEFNWLLEDFKFVPAGRILFALGNPYHKATYKNCYVIPIKEDSLEAIFDCAKEMARTYSYGGGVGTCIGTLRPKGTKTNNSAKFSTGAVSFMELYSTVTGVIGQSARRGALMLTIPVSHPDIEDFIEIKHHNRDKVKYANISIKLTDDFMQAVEDDTDFELCYETPYEKISSTVRARELWRKITKAARDSAEPGLLMWDNIIKESPADVYADEGFATISTNPCAEIPLSAYDSCNLGAVALDRYVLNPFTDGARFDYDTFGRAVRLGIRFLDNIITLENERIPLEQQRWANNTGRRLGLGVLGFGDMLAKLSIKYDSVEGLALAKEVFSQFRNIAYDASVELAKERGAFPIFNAEKHLSCPFIQRLPEELKQKITEHGLRNISMLTVAPTGSIAIIAQTTGGCEPIFETHYERNVIMGSENEENNNRKTYKVYHPLVKQYREMFGTEDASDELPDFFVSAHQIDSDFRVDMQGIIQQHIDHSISSTINLPSDVTTDKVASIYMRAWKAGLKGVTVYREGCRDGVLVTEEQAKKNADSKTNQELEKLKEEVADLQKKNDHLRAGKRNLFKRPLRMTGYTIRLELGESNRPLFTINEVGGKPKEMIITVGKSGDDQHSYAEVLGRSISAMLQAGWPVEKVVNLYLGVKSNTTALVKFNQADEKPIWVFGLADVAAKLLRALYSEEGKKKAKDIKTPKGLRGASKCPKCSHKALIRTNGCYQCLTCGHSGCA